MSDKITGYLMAAFILMVFGAIGELTTMSDAEMAKVNALMTMPVVKDAGFLGINFATTWLNFGADWIATLWGLLWMQFGFYQGEFSIFVVIFWLPVAIGIIYGLVALLRGTNA